LAILPNNHILEARGMKTRSGIIALALLLALGAWGGNAEARGMGCGGFGRDFNGMSAEQHETASRINDAHAKQLSELRDQMWDKKSELNALYAYPDPDQGKAQALVREITALRGQMMTERLAIRQEMAKDGLPAWGGSGNGPCRRGL
jgi:Spy/CpxP family protein refolding chaperone